MGVPSLAKWSNILLFGAIISFCSSFCLPAIDNALRESRRYTGAGTATRRALALSSRQNSDLDEKLQSLEELLIRQQQQLDRITNILSVSKDTSVAETVFRENVNGVLFANQTADFGLSPQKLMLFIDGTWLYYSIYERQALHNPIVAKFGPSWRSSHYVDWAALPRIMCDILHEQDLGWSSNSEVEDGGTQQGRPYEIARASVFTSFKADTHKASPRYQMFEDMKKLNYDLQLMTTTGRNEKCVDIALAVDMLHYATVPDSYDCAVIVTGDKDYLPAMIRTRQKGRKVALATCNPGCNKDLYHADNAMDFDVIWIDQHLEKLIKPKQDHHETRYGGVSDFTLKTIVCDFVRQSGYPSVSSRDVGRYLKSISFQGSTMIDRIKNGFGGLYQFLLSSPMYDVYFPGNEGSGDNSFWVGLTPAAERLLSEEASQTEFLKDEVKFLQAYDSNTLKMKKYAYNYTVSALQQSGEFSRPKPSRELMTISRQNIAVVPQVSRDLSQDYSTLTVAQLKELCRERGLKVSGTKAELTERLKKEKLDQEQIQSQGVLDDADTRLRSLILEFLQVSGGQTGSRDVGRYLAANKATETRCKESSNDRISALQELKENHGHLKKFLYANVDLFEVVPASGTEGFLVRLRNS